VRFSVTRTESYSIPAGRRRPRAWGWRWGSADVDDTHSVGQQSSSRYLDISIAAGPDCVRDIDFDCACEKVVGSTHFVESGTPLIAKILRLDVVSSAELLS
jgi:hypothetical protein